MKSTPISWSRTIRKKLSLLKAGSDPSQMKLSVYGDMVCIVAEVLSQTSECKCLWKETSRQSDGGKTEVLSFFQKLVVNAEHNSLELPKQRRHDFVIKKFATSLLIFAGPLAYKFLHRNMPVALPCLRTVQRIVFEEYCCITEGEFRFDELKLHLESYGTPKVVSIGEDATRVIARVEYDNQTNRLVGFVLPCDKDGLPITDSFLATSFDSIEKAFDTSVVSKYGFVYMAQALCTRVPSFCLGCFGTDNKFTTEHVLKRWNHIYHECQKRGIAVISFGADGDARELRGMKLSSALFSTPSDPLSMHCLFSTKSWKPWFAVCKPTSVSYVQDTVHIAVKMKCRLIKPSIILPLGNYVAGVHHLRMVQVKFGKDMHGLRQKDINHKDKQNYEAVLRMTSESVFILLNQIPDAKGTVAYLQVLRCIIDSFLDKSLQPLARIEIIWFALFFLRYWRHWIILHPQYTLDNNITQNAYMCVELNAHSLLTFLRTVQNISRTGSSVGFLPWLLGSQSCEKAFRAVRSMTSTFSTIINFGMLGLLRRLHRLHIQFTLEARADLTGIRYPRVEAHQKKDGHGEAVGDCFEILSINESHVASAIENARVKARELVKTLGMDELLHVHGSLLNPPVPLLKEHDVVGKDDDDMDEECVHEITPELLHECVSEQNETEFLNSISKLTKAGIINEDLHAHLTNLQQLSASTSPSTKEMASSFMEVNPEAQNVGSGRRRHCPYV